jgi:putative hydrolase of the HAD superfamily
MVQIYRDEAVVFDLDDLLFKEFDFVRSGFWTIASSVAAHEPKKLFKQMMVQYFSGNAVIDWVCNHYLKPGTEFTSEVLLKMYRTHKPDLSLGAEVSEFLTLLKKNDNLMGILTDGRSITQRNKIDALGLDKWITEYTISEELGAEKPSEVPYRYFMERFPGKSFVYIADNYNKDFIAPNQLGWRTIALADNGLNIHTKRKDLDPISTAREVIKSFRELEVCASKTSLVQ